MLWLVLLLAAPAFPSSYNYLTERDLAQVRRMMPAYQQAATLAGVPVLALPALHARESDLRGVRADPEARSPVHNLGGPFMMDMGADGNLVEFDARIRAFEQAVALRFSLAPAPRVRDNLFFAALCAGIELKTKARTPLVNRWGSVDREALADAFWGYNGRSYGSWRRSPYVSNHPVRGRRLLIHIPKGYSQSATTYLDARPGVLVIYDELVRRVSL